MQRDLSKTFAAAFRTLPCADAFLLMRRLAKDPLLMIGFGFQHPLLATPAGKRFLRTRFRYQLVELALRRPSRQRYPILGPAPFGNSSMISRGVYLSTLQRCCIPPNTRWYCFAETSTKAAGPAVLGMMSFRLLVTSPRWSICCARRFFRIAIHSMGA